MRIVHRGQGGAGVSQAPGWTTPQLLWEKVAYRAG